MVDGSTNLSLMMATDDNACTRTRNICMHCVGCYTQTYTTFVVTQIADQWLDHGRQDDLIHGVCVPIHYRAHDIVHDDRA